LRPLLAVGGVIQPGLTCSEHAADAVELPNAIHALGVEDLPGRLGVDSIHAVVASSVQHTSQYPPQTLVDSLSCVSVT
jgi:hypothetical protein